MPAASSGAMMESLQRGSLRPHSRAPCHPARRPRQFRKRRSVVSIDCPFFGLIRLKPDFFAQGGGRIERWSQFGDIVNKRLRLTGMRQVEWLSLDTQPSI